MDQGKTLSGMAIAAVAGALFIAGCGSVAPGHSAGSAAAAVKCYGANACKGQSECKTAIGSCKGHNACKGQGFVMLEERACIERFGRA